MSRSLLLGRAGWAVIAVAAAMHVLYNGFGIGRGHTDFIVGSWTPFVVCMLCAGCSFARGVACVRERVAWWAFAAGLVVYSSGQAYWILVLGNAPPQDFPSVADLLWLTLVPSAILTIVLLVRCHGGLGRRELWLDGAIGGLTVAAVAVLAVFGLVIDPVEAAHGAPANLAYALGDALIVGFGVGACAVMGWRPPRSLVLLIAAFAVLAVQDTLYLDGIVRGTWAPGSVLDSTWLVAMTAIAGAVAWSPSRETARRRSSVRMEAAFPSAFGLMAILLLAHVGLSGQPHPVPTVLATGALLAGVARFTATLLAHGRLLDDAEEQAVTDELTGLPNRRALLRDGALAVEAAREGRAVTLVVFDLDGFKNYNDTYGHPAGDALLVRLADKLARAAAPWGRAYRLGGDEFCALLWAQGSARDLAVGSATAALTEEGGAFTVHGSYGAVDLPREVVDLSDALRLADERLYAAKSRLSRRSRRGTDVDAGVHQVEPWMEEDLRPVGRLAGAVAQRVGVPDDELRHVVRAAELHDIGNIAIPDAILNKPGPLTEEEWRYVRRHTLIAERLVSRIPDLTPVARLLRSCHERYDGGGYPDGIGGREIPLGARIIFACEAFHAMTVDRPYRAGMPLDRAIAELREHAGTQFDPEVVAAVIAELEAGGLGLPPLQETGLPVPRRGAA